MGGVVVVPVELCQLDAIPDVPRRHPRPGPVGVQLRAEDGDAAGGETLHGTFQLFLGKTAKQAFLALMRHQPIPRSDVTSPESVFRDKEIWQQ